VPQGGPLSPLLGNILLNELDRELESRGHKFVRYADDRAQRMREAPDVTVFIVLKSCTNKEVKLPCRRYPAVNQF